jgi:Flp pilus assembly pilin Flp
MNLIKRFISEEDGMGTVELVLIVAALVSIAILFKNEITGFVERSVGTIFTGADAAVGGEAAPTGD